MVLERQQQGQRCLVVTKNLQFFLTMNDSVKINLAQAAKSSASVMDKYVQMRKRYSARTQPNKSTSHQNAGGAGQNNRWQTAHQRQLSTHARQREQLCKKFCKTLELQHRQTKSAQNITPIELAQNQNDADAAKKLTVVAIIIGYNEQDIIYDCIRHALEQGMMVQYVDDYSSDKTRQVVQHHFKTDDRVGFCMLPQQYRAAQSNGSWDLEKQLTFKRDLMRTQFASADWLVHMDCDEFYECPWAENVVQGLSQVDPAVGIVNCDVWDYFPTKKDKQKWTFESVAFPMHHIQHKLTVHRKRQPFEYRRFLRNSDALNLNLGHLATTEPNQLHTAKMIMHHFPYRSAALFLRKISSNRLSRIALSDRNKGVGKHYRQDQIYLRLPLDANLQTCNRKLLRHQTEKHRSGYLDNQKMLETQQQSFIVDEKTLDIQFAGDIDKKYHRLYVKMAHLAANFCAQWTNQIAFVAAPDDNCENFVRIANQFEIEIVDLSTADLTERTLSKWILKATIKNPKQAQKPATSSQQYPRRVIFVRHLVSEIAINSRKA